MQARRWPGLRGVRCLLGLDALDGTEGGVGRRSHLADGLDLVIVGRAGLGSLIGVVLRRGGSHLGVGACLAGRAVHFVLAGVGHSVPGQLGIAAAGGDLHHRLGAVAGSPDILPC